MQAANLHEGRVLGPPCRSGEGREGDGDHPRPVRKRAAELRGIRGADARGIRHDEVRAIRHRHAETGGAEALDEHVALVPERLGDPVEEVARRAAARSRWPAGTVPR